MRPEGEHEGARAGEYVVGHLQEAFAADGRLAEIALHVRVVADGIYVSGSVPTAERKIAVQEIAARECPGFTIHNDVSVTEISDAPEPEELD